MSYVRGHTSVLVVPGSLAWSASCSRMACSGRTASRVSREDTDIDQWPHHTTCTPSDSYTLQHTNVTRRTSGQLPTLATNLLTKTTRFPLPSCLTQVTTELKISNRARGCYRIQNSNKNKISRGICDLELALINKSVQCGLVSSRNLLINLYKKNLLVNALEPTWLLFLLCTVS